MMGARIILKPADVRYLDEAFGDPERGGLRPVPAGALERVPQDHLMQWCVERAIYQPPIAELIDLLAERIAGRRAIEIGSGGAGIGRALGIPSTDSYIQTTPEVRALYAQMQQPVVEPPEYVERLDALAAIEKHNPDVVLGCFVTNLYKDGDKGGSVFGVDEDLLLKRCAYIHVGNRSKRILKLPYLELAPRWLRSRAIVQSDNVIWEWEKGASNRWRGLLDVR